MMLKDTRLIYIIMFSVKGHFEEKWTTPTTYLEPDSVTRIIPSGSEYTVVSLRQVYPLNAQVDFQVEAFVGISIPTIFQRDTHLPSLIGCSKLTKPVVGATRKH